MKILYIGRTDTYQFCKEGINPSHWLYGALEMEKDGNEVIWADESIALLNDWKLIRKHQPDCVFIHNLNMREHLILSALKVLGMVRCPIFGFLHHTPKGGKAKVLYWMFLRGIKHIFFLSEKTMKETIERGYAKKKKCSTPGWGPDIDFYNKIPKKNGKWFVSTGKEHRDFNILIEAFKRTGAPLKIMTAQSHAGNEYGYLKKKCQDITNIEVVITENSGSVYPQMLTAMAEAKGLVCPLIKENLNYCVGLSTIADAIGLNKPLLITRNPYHDTTYLDGAKIVETVDDWVKNIEDMMKNIENTTIRNRVNMTTCYQKMKKEMGL